MKYDSLALLDPVCQRDPAAILVVQASLPVPFVIPSPHCRSRESRNLEPAGEILSTLSRNVHQTAGSNFQRSAIVYVLFVHWYFLF